MRSTVDPWTTEGRPRLCNPRGVLCDLDTIVEQTFHRDFFLRDRPFVLRDGVGHWPALENWREDGYLAQIAGHVSITYQTASDRSFDTAARTHRVSLTDFLTVYRQHPECYINDIDIPAPLLDELGTFDLLQAFEQLDGTRSACGFFLGAGGQFSDLHFDDVDLLYVVLDGQKIFYIFDIGDLRRMYPRSDPREAFFSRIRLRDHDRHAFPEFSDATLYEACLSPGDVLYLPAHYWHAVETIGRSVAVSHVRVDRRSQLQTFIKLLENHHLPLTSARHQELTDMLAGRPPAELSQTQSPEEWLLAHDVYGLYLRLALCHAHRRNSGQDTSLVERQFHAAKGLACQRLQSEVADPTVRDLMIDLYQPGDENDGSSSRASQGMIAAASR